MSLRRKFAFLLALLGLTACVSVGAAFWAVRLLDEELAHPFTKITSALAELQQTKRDIWEQCRLVLAAEAPDVPIPETSSEAEDLPAGPPAARFRRLGEIIAARFDALDHNDAFTARAGVSAWRNLRTRVESAQPLAMRWWDSGDAAARAAATRELLIVHELVERAVSGVLKDAALARDYGQGLRRVVLLVLGFSLATAVLVASFAFLRLRRWVLRPVGDLRVAASRIAGGDFAHRVPLDEASRDELALLAREVNHMAGMVSSLQEERVNRERLAAVGEMVRRLAHNLRNPLAGIRALAEISAVELPERSDLRENQNRIISTVDRFEGWLGALLQTTAPLAIRPSPQAVAPWMRKVAETLAPMAEAKGVRLGVQCEQAPSSVEFDDRHLEQALVALLTNAVQATPPGGRVTVKADVLGERWRLMVADEGSGVPAELLGRIFEAHFTTKRDGTGMGLALCRQVVAEHGGSISVDRGAEPPTEPRTSPPTGPGAVFIISLPLRARVRPRAGGENGDRDGRNSDHRR